jgi:hypothetical protein
MVATLLLTSNSKQDGKKKERWKERKKKERWKRKIKRDG